MLITTDLFRQILLEPFENGADELCIITGYASAAMVFKHQLELSKLKQVDWKINLIIGMASKDGITRPDHKAYNELMSSDLKDKFFCSYIYDSPPVHSKVFTWLKNGQPFQGFIGSCNYSQSAFIKSSQLEIAYKINAKQSFDYYQSLIDKSIYCNLLEAENLLKPHHDNNLKYNTIEETSDMQHNIQGLQKVTVSLLDRYGQVTERSQLNWGQRQGREPNQAYFQLSPEVYNSDFFPVRGIHFSVLTDDDVTLICTRAQKDEVGHAIETPHNNSLLGEYIRKRLGVSNGAKVEKQHLINYGRTNIDFYKVDDETYYMDFSV